MKELESVLASLPHVTTVRSFTGSLPDQKTLSVADQLRLQAQAVREGIADLEQVVAAADGVGPGPGSNSAPGSGSGQGSSSDPGSGTDDPAATLQAASEGLTNLYGYLLQLAQSYPEVLQDAGYLKALDALSGLAAIAQDSEDSSAGEAPSLDEAVLEQALARLSALADGLEELQTTFSGRPEAILLPDLYLDTNEGLRALRDSYISTDGTATRFQVVLDVGPYSPEAISTVQTMRAALADTGFQGFVDGSSAVLLDLQEASNRDMTRAIIYVLSGIFVVLIILLRALIAPIYLILTILLSYTATLGVVRLLFVDILGAAGIVWWVPMFMFVMLVALGMDYNIFLIGRVKEEVAPHGTRAGTRLALARTGGIITSAGIIMAGTFASMLSASILGLLQIGFAVAFGVLLDTFVVRTTLVPAIIVLLGRWSWWPRRWNPEDRSD